MIKLDDRVSDNQKQVAEIAERVRFMNEHDTHAGKIVAERVRQLERNQGWIVRRLIGVEPGTPPSGEVPNETNEQIVDDITAAMADAWLAACDRRVIAPAIVARTSFVVIDRQGNVPLFGPASADECVLFVHRAAARV
jgi:hypothetical protein